MRALLACCMAAAVALALVAVSLGGAGDVSADNGPHVQGASTADGCAGCHRAHTGQAAELLKADQVDLCYTCHGTGGPGADTAVQEGKLYSGTSFTALRAGGFDYAMIDTDDPSKSDGPGATPVSIDALATPQASTSGHTIDGSTETLWGNGSPGSGAGGNYDLACAKCHDPHGNGKYRILRPQPPGTSGGGANVTDEGTPDYDTTDYFDVGYSSSTMSDWCSQCHTRYKAGNGSAETPLGGGEDIFVYRHESDGAAGRPNCIKCHAAHGTNAVTTDSGFSESVPWPGGTPAPSGENTRLLKMNDRGICQKCHDR